ncbi:MAG: hypothetical protein H7325_13035 [Pedobacter sp.]|nr:hypothetical protein [Pedobacter sp.]
MRSKKTLLIVTLTCFALLISPIIFAQDIGTDSKNAGSVESVNKAKIYFVGFGLEREQKISNQSTLYIGAAIEGVVPFLPSRRNKNTDILRIDYGINIAPTIDAGYKNYYNLHRRNNLGKVIKNNSASFVGFEYSLINPILFNNNYTTKFVNSFSPVWGFQRKVSSNKVNANLELIIGPSFQTDFRRTRVSGFLRFGYSLIF